MQRMVIARDIGESRDIGRVTRAPCSSNCWPKLDVLVAEINRAVGVSWRASGHLGLRAGSSTKLWQIPIARPKMRGSNVLRAG